MFFIICFQLDIEENELQVVVLDLFYNLLSFIDM